MKNISPVQVLRRGAQKSLLHRHVDNNVDTSVQVMRGTWCKVRFLRDRDCFAWRTVGKDKSIIMGYSGSTDLVFSCIGVPDRFGYGTALVCERESRKK